ncbi:MAG TPA: phosphotransferase, partial [Bacillales bacterium]|nr:phosphotransferase [Bacillales bacterium]
NDRLVESLRTTAGEFHAVCFAKAAGGPAKPEDWNDQLFHTLGKIMGKMHKLTRTYEPKASAVRHDWEAVLRQDLQTSEAWLSDKFKALLDYFSALPQDRDRYGLIHDDIHRGNFFVTDDSLTLFDFDDCKYSWFAEDIAVALFYAIPPDGEETKRCETAQIFYESFLNGYETVLSAPAGLGEWLPYFLKLRELQVYAAIQKSGLDENKLTGWAGSFMKERKPKLVNDVPYLNGDQWF